MTSIHTPEFKEQAVQKTLQRGSRTIQCVADELNLNVGTLKYWLKSYRRDTMNSPTNKRLQDWTAEQRLQALLETHALSDTELNAYCRKNGVFTHHLEAWKSEFAKRHSSRGQKPSSSTLRLENNRLKKELARKEKALAETAALLVLQKKFTNLWEDGVC